MTPSLMAIDPGTTESAWVRFVGGVVTGFAKEANDVVLNRVGLYAGPAALVVCEELECYGKVIGKSALQTARWCGRFEQKFLGGSTAVSHACWRYVPRRAVKLELCGTNAANDKAVRMAAADVYGGPEQAKGTKRAPGPLYGMRADCWQALALGITWMRLQDSRRAAA